MTKLSSSFIRQIALAATFSSAAALLALVACAVGVAQTAPYKTNQNLTPPLYGNYSVAIPNAYLLHFPDWPFLTGANGMPPNAGVQRVNGGANWNQLETARGTYSSTLGSMNFAWSGSCATVSGSGSSSNGWLPAADCNNTNATITEGGSTKIAGNLLYSFNTVPGWASSGGTGWPVSAITVTNCASGTCTVNLTINATGFTLNANSSQKDVVAVNNLSSADAGASLNGTPTLSGVSGSGATTVITYTLSQKYYSGNTQITRQDCPSVVSCTVGTGLATYGATYPPSDIYNWTETCSGSDVYLGTSVKGDCYFREFVTHLMEQNCNVSSLPASPLYGSCAIHYFEGWNEFNADGFWEGNYTKLAEMMVDADEIVKHFCGDCYFIAGSVSAGGDGYHQYYTSGADGSAVYSEALGQLLHDWYYQTDTSNPRYASPIYPDAISFHPYPSHDTLLNPPMPETNLSYNDQSDIGCYPNSISGDRTGINEPAKYSGTWTEPQHLACRDSVISSIIEIQNLVSQLPSAYNFPAGIPVWNTESGIGPIFASDQGIALTSASSHDPWDASLTAYVNQSYLARQAILTAASGDALNLWYQADNTLWGPLFYLPANQWLKSTSFSVGNFIWDGQSIQQVQTAGTTGSTFPGFNHGGSTTNDGSVVWKNVSTNWVANNNYGGGAIVWDGHHLQETKNGGISGASAPVWSSTQGGTTGDGSVTWENLIADPNIVSGTNSIPVATPMGRTFGRIYTWFHGRNIQFTGIPASSLKTYAHSAAFSTNDLVSENGLLYRAATAGTTATFGPTWVQGMYNVLTDGGVTWELIGTGKCWDNSTFTGTLTNGAGTIATQSVWTCPVSEVVNGSNYTGQLVWYTQRESTNPYAVPPGTNCIWDIDGNELSRKYPANMTVFNRPALIDNYVDSVCTAP
ncbi:MAG TPA: hypothetical protein VGN01_03680 [Acidobacteriaceae bacterium]|jgi:hypothetical protein